MTPFEWLAVAYFVALLAAAPGAPRWRRGTLYVCGAIALVIVARFALPWAARVWVGLAYLVLGYWIPASFTRGPNQRFERWLRDTDVTRGWRVPGGGVVRHVLETAYLCCYPLVPAAFAIVFTYGTTNDSERFWLAVLGAGYSCYAALPWTAARPPRLLTGAETDPVPHAVAALNAQVLGRVSHQLVTFPSGHVAVAVAAAFAVTHAWWAAGVAFGLIAALIAVAAVAGRYHYLLDVLSGLLVGALAAALTY